MNELSAIVQNILKERYSKNICAFFYKSLRNEIVATGNFLNVNGKSYVVTCKHVAEKFFDSKEAVLVTVNKEKLFKNDLKYVWNSNNAIDLALIEITQYCSESTFLIEDFEVINDFSIYPFEKEDFYLYGVVAEYVEVKPKKRTIQPLSILTTLYQDKISNDKYLYCSYPKKINEIITTHPSGQLPESGGLSGSFIFKVHGFESEKLWHTGNAKVIAILTASDNANYLKCTNIRFLINEFEKNYNLFDNQTISNPKST